MKTIVFDFDGTIADSYEYVLAFLRREAGREQKINEHEQVELRGFSMATMARKLGMPWWRMPFLFFKGRREMARHINEVQLFEGADTVIRHLYDQGHKIFFVSSNSAVNIEYFLERHGLKKYTSGVYGGAGIRGKAPLLRKLVKIHDLKFPDCWYIGDEARDVRTARRLGMHSLAVTWGYNNAALLHKENPTAIAFKLPEIIDILQKGS